MNRIGGKQSGALARISTSLALLALFLSAPSVSSAASQEDSDALARIAEAVQLGIYVGSGLALSDIGAVERDRQRWYRAGFLDQAYPGIAEYLDGTLVRFRDPDTLEVTEAPAFGPPPQTIEYVEDLRLAKLKPEVRKSRFKRRVRLELREDTGFTLHSELSGDLRLQAPGNPIRLKGLSITATLDVGPDRPPTLNAGYAFKIVYKRGQNRYAATVAVDLPGALPAAGSDYEIIQVISTKRNGPFGTIQIDLGSLRTWAFDGDANLIARLPGAPIGSGTFDVDTTGNSEPPPEWIGAAFFEISGQAPDFNLPTADGSMLALSDPQFENDVVLINFCGSWCTPCREEFPELRELQASYGDQGLQVLTVGMFEEAEYSFGLPSQFGFNFPLVAAGESFEQIARLYGNISDIPTSYLLDRKRNVVRAFTGARTKEELELTLGAMGFEYADREPPEVVDEDGDGWSAGYPIGDCDDDDPDVNPGLADLCDGKDNDCDGLVDEESDQDGDGAVAESCGGSDCDDFDPFTFPGADEICDGWDNDCDGVVPADEVDADFDGVPVCFGDCDDTDEWTSPGAFDPSGDWTDGRDQDCNGTPDDGFFIIDFDGDRYDPPLDCDDANFSVNPLARDYSGDAADGIDTDCNGIVDDGPPLFGPLTDADGDGFFAEYDDCDDSDRYVNPVSDDWLGDGIDQDCNGFIDDGFVTRPSFFP